MKAIAAMAAHRVIGAAGTIPWHLPEDFHFFKKTTMGHAIVMGRKTYESLGKPLPGRHNIVLTRRKISVPGVTIINNLEDLKNLGIATDDIFVIGGEEIYRLLLPECDELLITHVLKEVPGDTFFPSFEEEFDQGAILLTTADFVIKQYRRVKPKNVNENKKFDAIYLA